MYQFAIATGEENSYTPAAPKGVFVARSSLTTQKSEAEPGCHVPTAGFGKWVIW
jgi:hypothetical protein